MMWQWEQRKLASGKEREKDGTPRGKKKKISCVPKALVLCEDGLEFISLGSPSSHKMDCEVFWNIK